MRRPILLPLALCSLLPLATGCQESSWTPPPPKAMANGLDARLAPDTPGVIEGHIRLSGPVPALPPLPTSRSVASVCGATVPDRSLVVSPEGGLAYVVVALADGTNGPAPVPEAPPAVLAQKRCAYEPPVLAARAGTSLEVRNEDALLHNVDALAGSQRPVLDAALPLEGSRVRRPLPGAPGVLQVGCKLHPWMSAAIRTFEHPWFTTTDASGHFRLEVPPGTHSFILWHPRLPGVTRSVSVRAGQTVSLDYAWTVEEVRGLSPTHVARP